MELLLAFMPYSSRKTLLQGMLAVGLSKAGQAVWLTGSTDVLALAAGSRVLLCHIPNLTASGGEEVTCSSDSPYIFSCPSEDSVDSHLICT